MLQQGGQLKKQVGIEPPRRQTKQAVWRRIGPVCPFAGNAEAAAIQFPEQESVNTCDSARFQNLEALAAKRMERMADLRPSQMRIALWCSSR